MLLLRIIVIDCSGARSLSYNYFIKPFNGYQIWTHLLLRLGNVVSLRFIINPCRFCFLKLSDASEQSTFPCQGSRSVYYGRNAQNDIWLLHGMGTIDNMVQLMLTCGKASSCSRRLPWSITKCTSLGPSLLSVELFSVFTRPNESRIGPFKCNCDDYLCCCEA